MTTKAECVGEYPAMYWECPQCNEKRVIAVLSNWIGSLATTDEYLTMLIEARAHEDATGHETMLVEQKVAS